jgi:membrane-bound ClpP family serine protease
MWPVILILILIGLLMLILEVLVIPGSGVAGIIGFILIAVGIWLAYTREGVYAGHITLAVTLGVNLIGLILVLRSGTWKKAMLDTKIDSKAHRRSSADLKVGKKGTTVSRCAPMGKAAFDNKFYEVSAYTEFIDENTDVEIVKISGNKIYIKKLK